MNSTYRKYLYSPKWKAIRQKIVKRSQEKYKGSALYGYCEYEGCGYSAWRLGVMSVHHLTYRNIFHEENHLEDLLLVCPKHHKLLEEQKKNKLS